MNEDTNPLASIGMMPVPPLQKIPYWLSVGLPKGFNLGLRTGRREGAVLLGGDLVQEMTSEEYQCWATMLVPKTSEQMNDIRAQLGPSADQVLGNLTEQGLIRPITPGEVLSDGIGRLRPIPIGVGIGNLDDDPGTFLVGEWPAKPVMSIDGLGQVLWLRMDGKLSLQQVSDSTASWLDLDTEDLERGATKLVVHLMGARLLYLDSV